MVYMYLVPFKMILSLTSFQEDGYEATRSVFNGGGEIFLEYYVQALQLSSHSPYIVSVYLVVEFDQDRSGIL